MAWPRASFGLPIQLQFQSKDRGGGYYAAPEPRGNQPRGVHLLSWHDGKELRERLPSPLVVKPMQLLNGDIVPVALWLSRTLPAKAMVGLVDGNRLQAGTAAQFDDLRGLGDPDFFTALAGKATTREAFMDWLGARTGMTRVTL
jgi:hypothetical protein